MSFLASFRDVLACWRQSAVIKTTERKRELLAITPDNCFYSSIAYATARDGWTVRWTRSASAAMAILARRPTPVILYDWCCPAEHWTAAVECLKLTPDELCIILAARGVNEDLWCQAIDRGVYDVVSRKGDMRHLVATLQFAWKWKMLPFADQRSCNG
jgi:DNA-binding NtrC family response regulator